MRKKVKTNERKEHAEMASATPKKEFKKLKPKSIHKAFMSSLGAKSYAKKK